MRKVNRSAADRSASDGKVIKVRWKMTGCGPKKFAPLIRVKIREFFISNGHSGEQIIKNNIPLGADVTS